MGIDINCDMGEAYSIYTCGDDEAIMPYITSANVACGFHASDPGVMHATRRARQAARREGRRASLLSGPGRLRQALHEDGPQRVARRHHLSVRRAEGLPRDGGHGAQPPEAARGALRRRLDRRGRAHACAEAAQVFGVPMYGTTGTMHETVWPTYHGRGLGDLRRPRLRRRGPLHHHPGAQVGGAGEGGRAGNAGGRAGRHPLRQRQGRADQGRDRLRPFGHAQRGRGRQGRARGRDPYIDRSAA